MRGGQPTVRVRTAQGADLAVHCLGGEGPPLIVAHATGFHGRCYTRMALPIRSDFTVWALDQRGHGQSAPSPDGRHGDWEAAASDVLDVVAEIGGEGWSAAGHSFGGGVVLLAEARRPGTFAALCCYEPVVFPPSGHGDDVAGAGGEGDPGSLAVLARKRRPGFASRRAALDNYRSKPPFASFDPEVLADYVEHGLVDVAGGVVLACPPEVEAAVFEGASSPVVWGALPRVAAPTAVLCGADTHGPARFASAIARRIPRGGLHRMDHLDHFGPFAAPVEVGEEVASALLLARGGSRSAVTPQG